MSETKVYTLKQVEEENSPSKPLLVINNAVYDVTTFLNEVRKSSEGSILYSTKFKILPSGYR